MYGKSKSFNKIFRLWLQKRNKDLIATTFAQKKTVRGAQYELVGLLSGKFWAVQSFAVQTKIYDQPSVCQSEELLVPVNLPRDTCTTDPVRIAL